MLMVLRKPKPLRRSVSVRVILDGVLWRMVSTGRSRGMVDCGVTSVSLWSWPLRMRLDERRLWRRSTVMGIFLVTDVRARPSPKDKVSLWDRIYPRRKWVSRGNFMVIFP